MNFKKFFFIICILFVLSSCARSHWTESGNENYFKMSYQGFNESNSQMIRLKKGEKFVGLINNLKGKMTIKILNKNSNTIFEKSIEKEKEEITFEAPEDGEYTCIVIGKKAKGNFSLLKQ